MVSKPLKTLNELEAFDGVKYSTELHRDKPLPKCKHEIYVVSSTEVKCRKCSAGWIGKDAYKLALH